MSRSAIFVSIFALSSALAAGSAAAQAVGTYTGTSADGSTLTFTVSRPQSSGPLMITSAGINYTAICPKGTPSVTSGIGFDPQATIKSKKAAYKNALPSYFYESFNLVFDTSNNTVTGNVTSVTPQLKKRAGTPTHSYVCSSGTQALTASLTTPAAVGPQATPSTVHYAQ